METFKEHDLQEKVNSFVTPDDVGRIPSKIASFSGFTADQWRNWILIFSLYSLKEILPYQHYRCWHLFVKACYCRRSIEIAELEEGDRLLWNFVSNFKIYMDKPIVTLISTYMLTWLHVYRILGLFTPFGYSHSNV